VKRSELAGRVDGSFAAVLAAITSQHEQTAYSDTGRSS
jgi:hypothetical protein